MIKVELVVIYGLSNIVSMNKIAVLLAALALTLPACSKRFGPLYKDAQEAFAEGKWIETIDNINLGLPFWKESDGQENKAQAYQLLGKAYHKLQKIDKASDAYAKAIELSTNTYDSAYQLGLIYLTSKQTDQSIKSFKEALKMKKDDPAALLGLGNAYYDSGKLADAKVFYQRIIESSPAVREALDFLRLLDDKMKAKSVKKSAPKQPRGYMKIKKR
jgi:tetratricopeptide (TPR) repeat protein